MNDLRVRMIKSSLHNHLADNVQGSNFKHLVRTENVFSSVGSIHLFPQNVHNFLNFRHYEGFHFGRSKKVQLVEQLKRQTACFLPPGSVSKEDSYGLVEGRCEHVVVLGEAVCPAGAGHDFFAQFHIDRVDDHCV